jgi:epoxyqueuosine reductase QueG
LAVPYGEQLSPDDYTEEKFERGIQTAKGRLETVTAEIEQILQMHHVKYWIPPAAQENETELRALFSFKTAAARAGIGWFGKNDVIITERYGPRVRLSAILIDEIFPYGQPVTAGRCPDDCTKCIDICPCKALKNRQWTIEKDRSEIIDYQKCNRMRSAFIKKLGRKNSCGLCLAVCPFGISGQKSPGI